jgi:hypothetical protein
VKLAEKVASSQSVDYKSVIKRALGFKKGAY